MFIIWVYSLLSVGTFNLGACCCVLPFGLAILCVEMNSSLTLTLEVQHSSWTEILLFELDVGEQKKRI